MANAKGYCRVYDKECKHSEGHGVDGLVICNADTCPYEDDDMYLGVGQ